LSLEVLLLAAATLLLLLGLHDGRLRKEQIGSRVNARNVHFCHCLIGDR